MKKLLIAFMFPLAVFGQGTPTLRFNTVADMVAKGIPTVNNSLAAMVTGRVTANDGGGGIFYFTAASSATTNLGTIFPSTGVAGRWFRQYSGPVNVKWFGAIGDDSSNNSTAFTNAIAFAQSSNTNLFIPSGIYRVQQSLNLAPALPITILGEGYYASIIKMNSASVSSNVITIGDNATQSVGYTFRDFQVDANAKATNGIYSSRASHTLIDHVRVTGCTAAGYGINIGYGWDNDILECQLELNTGGGIHLNADFDFANNADNIINNKIFNNSGIGIRLTGGRSIRMEGNTIEQNAVTGIFAYNAPAISIINNYFEGNASTGYVFTSPVVTNKVDIILNGDNTTLMNAAAPVWSSTISGNQISGGVEDTFILAAGVRTAQVFNNHNNFTFAPLNLITTPANGDYGRVDNLTIEANTGFATNIVATQLANLKAVEFSTWKIKGVSRKNYLDQNFLLWGPLSGGGDIKRGDLSFNGFPTAVITNRVGTTGFGVNVNVDNYTELQGALVYVGAWVKQSVNTIGAAAAVNGKSSTASTSTDTAWRWVEMQDILPTTGTIQVGFYRIGGIATDVLYIACPVFCVLGNDAPTMFSESEYKIPRWQMTAAPTIGSWVQGDVIWNSAPAISSHEGVVCVTSGEPGTWKTFGSIALSSFTGDNVTLAAQGSGTFTIDATGDFFLFPTNGVANRGVIGAATTKNQKLALSGTVAGSAAAGASLGIWSIQANAGNRNWSVENAMDNFGDLSFRQSNAKDGDPSSAGTTIAIMNASGFALMQAGDGLLIKEGSNARMGRSVMVNSTVTVSNTSVTASTEIFLTRRIQAGTTVGVLQVGTVTPGVSFVIEASTLVGGALSADDDSTVNWILIEPSP